MKNWLLVYTLCLIGLNGFSQNLGYDEASPGSKISIHGNLSVGAGYSNVAAPTSGAIIQGSTGIGTSAPVSALDVNGGVSIGAYAGISAAPSNGLIVSGNTGIGNSSPTSLLSVGSASQFQVNSTGNIVKVNNVTTSFPSLQGAANTVLTNDGTGNLSWAAASGSGSVGTSYALTAALNDPNTALGGTYTEIGEATVTVASGDAVITDAFFSAEANTNSFIVIRVTRSQTAGSATVGTPVGYSAVNPHNGTTSSYVSMNINNRETALTAGTWYYKFWVTAYVAGTQNYQMVISRAK